MMNFNSKPSKNLILCLAMASLAAPALAHHRQQDTQRSRGTAVACPWIFENGNETSRTMAVSTTEEIMRRAGYSAIPGDVALRAWDARNEPESYPDDLPSTAALESFGRSVNATVVVYGTVTWNTRSIWVNLGPKTISTAKVNVYVFDVASDKVIYHRNDVEGRSDEKSDGYKIAADVLFTPLVTAVSGGPSTPHEQRAVQIALAKALRPWARPRRNN